MSTEQQNPSIPDTEATQAQETAVFPAVPASKPRNQHLKSPDPKSIQWGGRSTVSEAERIQEVIDRYKPTPESKFDIVRLVIKMLDHANGDFLSPFKTKKKR